MRDSLFKDLRLAFRQLAKSKGFTITAVVTLALGIGANTAIFTLMHAIMLKSLPVSDPESLIRLGEGDNCCVIGGFQGHFSIFAHPLYAYLRDHTREFEEMAAFQAGLSKVGVRRVGGTAASEPFVDQFVSGSYFQMFGLRPFAGRLLSPVDDVSGATPVAIMSYRAWQQHYGADPSMIGATFIIEGAPFTIVGIAPPGFFGDTLRPDPPDFWLPLADEPVVRGKNSLLNRADQHWLYIIGRVKTGTRVMPLETEININLQQWLLANTPSSTEASRQKIGKEHITLTPAGAGVGQMKETFKHDLSLLMAITCLVLLIACANLANLQLARTAANLTQSAIRIALGAQRFRVIRQTLTESIVLALAGGASALIVATQLTRLLIHFALGATTYVPIDTKPSLPVLGFTFVVSLLTGVVFGVAPAWSASRADPAAALHGAGRRTAYTTLPQKSLVVLQAALSLILLVAAGLMTETLRNLQDQQFGFRMEGTMVVNVSAGFGEYAPEKLDAIYRQIEQQVQQVPGVRDSALALYSPMSGNNWQSGVTLEGASRTISPAWDRVSPSFFRTIGVPILRGRMFDERDRSNSTHVAVINKAFSDKFFPDVDPVGRRFGLGGVEHSGDYQIIGVSDNVVFRSPRQPIPTPMFFLPLLQMSRSEWEDSGKARSNLIQSIILHVVGPVPNLTGQIQRAMAGIDPNLTALNVTTIEEQLGDLLHHEQLLARLAEIFGVLAVILASIGLYGLTAYSVARRTSEIGVRTALGATRTRIVRMILTESLTQIGIGLILGIPAAMAAARFLANQLYGVKTWDPLILIGAAITLAACATLAGLIPALRASTIDPVTALRVDA